MLSTRRLSCPLALLLLCVPALLSQARDTLVVLHTSDTHVVFTPGEYPHPLANAFTGNRSSIDSLQKFFRSTPTRERADAVVITGDILACFEGVSKSEKMLACQIEPLRQVLDECPVPLFLTLGNHDVSSYTLHQGDSSVVTSQTGAGRARASWIRNIPCFANGTYYARLFEVGRARYHFIFLDDSYSLRDGGRRLEKAQLDWLNEQVRRAGEEPVVLFHHIYFPIGDVNNDGVVFDRRKPVDWPTEKDCAEGFLRVLNDHPSIRLLVVGHGHENAFEKIRFPGGHSIYQVETSSVTEGSGNWRILRFTASGISVSKPGSRETEIFVQRFEKATSDGRNE